MNKKEFINELSKRLNISEDKSSIINDILEDNFLIGKKHKDAMIQEIVSKLGIESDEAENIYETAMELLKDGLKDKLKHPFKSQD